MFKTFRALAILAVALPMAACAPVGPPPVMYAPPPPMPGPGPGPNWVPARPWGCPPGYHLGPQGARCWRNF
jgi:hypothetical protein